MGFLKKNQTHLFYLCRKRNRYWLTLLHTSFLFWLSSPLFCDPIRILPSDSRFEVLNPTDNDGITDIFITNPAIENPILNHFILRGTVWAKRVELNMEGLKSASRQETESIQITLSEDQKLLGKIDTVILRSGTEFTLSGILNEEPASSFTITLNDLSVSGGFRTGDGRHYELYYDAIEKSHAMAEINDGQAIHPNQIHDLDEVSIPLTQRNQPLAVPASDDGTILDMMILYTPAAREAAGGTSSILAICDRAVDEMNVIFKKSGVIPRVRLVHKKEIAYTELRNESGGVMDHEDRAALENMNEVNTLRDQYGADMVSFFTVGIGSGVLVWPYSLTGWDCAISSYTFAHEAGHGMGCHHAVGDTWDGNPPGQAKGSGKFPYSHGWHLFIGTQRYSTVMAYPSPDNYRYSTWATQIPHYSNPDITYQNVSTGNRINGEDDANNARTINEMAYTIANWKASKSVPASPANVKASEVGDYTDKVRITWSPSTGATYYRVYRIKVIGGIPDPVSEWQTMTSFNDTTVPPWQTYWYGVKAAKSNTGSLPSEFSIFDSGERGLPPPEINASGGSYSDKVRISWDAVEGANTYRVYRSDSLTGTKQPISNWISATYFDDTNTTVLVKYYYWVQSSIGQGNIASDYSQSDYGWRYISTPTGVTASNGTSSEYVEITWNAVEGATHYRVYRSDSQEGSKTGVSNWIANTFYHDTSAVGNKVYYYWVGASINSTGFDSVMSSESDSGWRKLLPSPTPTPTKTRTPTRTPVPIDRTPTPHFVTPTPMTFVTPKPTFHIITPTPTPYTVLAIGGGNIETAVWKSVTIPILAQNLANTKSIYFEITYDKNLLTWEGEYSKENTLLSSWSAVDVQSISTNRLQFGAACFGKQGVSGNGTLINLNFIAKMGTASSTTTRIQFARFGDNVKNAKGLPIVVTIKNSQDPLKGDVNGDGLLADEDAQLTFDIFNKKITPSDYQTWAADFNNDAKVTPFDAQSIYEAILQR